MSTRYNKNTNQNRNKKDRKGNKQIRKIDQNRIQIGEENEALENESNFLYSKIDYLKMEGEKISNILLKKSVKTLNKVDNVIDDVEDITNKSLKTIKETAKNTADSLKITGAYLDDKFSEGLKNRDDRKKRKKEQAEHIKEYERKKKLNVSRAKFLKNSHKDFVYGYKKKKGTYYKNGLEVFTAKKRLYNSTYKNSSFTANAGVEVFVHNLLHTEPRQIYNMPNTTEAANLFRETLAEIQERNLFNLDTIKLTDNIHQNFKDILNEFTGQRIEMGLVHEEVLEQKMNNVKPKVDEAKVDEAENELAKLSNIDLDNDKNDNSKLLDKPEAPKNSTDLEKPEVSKNAKEPEKPEAPKNSNDQDKPESPKNSTIKEEKPEVPKSAKEIEKPEMSQEEKDLRKEVANIENEVNNASVKNNSNNNKRKNGM